MRAGGILFFFRMHGHSATFLYVVTDRADSYGPNFDFLYLLDVNNDKGVV